MGCEVGGVHHEALSASVSYHKAYSTLPKYQLTQGGKYLLRTSLAQRMHNRPPLPLRLRHPIRLSRRYQHVRRKRFDFAVYFAFAIDMKFVRQLNCAIRAVLETFRSVFCGVDGGEYVMFVVAADAGDEGFEHVVLIFSLVGVSQLDFQIWEKFIFINGR